MVFSRRGPPVFLPKRPKKGPFLLSVRFFGVAKAVLGLDGEELTQILEHQLYPVEKPPFFSFQPSGMGSTRGAAQGLITGT
jgi:hypothetical protein